jgi:hypothetical protein
MQIISNFDTMLNLKMSDFINGHLRKNPRGPSSV